jgi:hypothetical protein
VAGDAPRDLPFLPLVHSGALDAPGGSLPQAAATFAPLEPQLFSLAWLITGGHDGVAAYVVAQAREQFVSSWSGAIDPVAYARLVLVPRACRAAARVEPQLTGTELLDQLLAVPPRARAALVLHEALGLDDAASGQLLEIDQHDAASLQRHALGACRFAGVPELVRTTFDEQVVRVVMHGVPAPTRPRRRRKPLLIGAIVTIALLAGLLTWCVL